MEIIVHELNGNPVEQKVKTGYINGTNICKSCYKDISTWKRSKAAKDLIEALEADLQICRSELMYSERGANRGTWVHPDLAVPLAMWASPRFAISRFSLGSGMGSNCQESYQRRNQHPPSRNLAASTAHGKFV